MITTEQQERIAAALMEARKRFPSDAKLAKSLGLSQAIFSRLKKGEREGLLADAKWISIARQLQVPLRKSAAWKTARTATFEHIMAQLEFAQEGGLSAILCDIPNIGKTYTAKYYTAGHANVVYIDCSQTKTKRQLVRKIAEGFGVNAKGKYADMYEDLTYYLRSIEKPLIILDEAGDLQYEAFLELKALWNATERACAWYMMGADGLKAKITRNIEAQKVGYTEMFSRYGDRFSKVTPDDGKERAAFLREQAAIVAKVNAPEGYDVAPLVRKTQGGLRRVYTEIEKLRSHE